MAVYFLYFLYLCTQSDMTCDRVTWTAITTTGIEHRAYTFGDLDACKAQLEKEIKSKPPAYNQWYECRKEKGKNDY